MHVEEAEGDGTYSHSGSGPSTSHISLILYESHLRKNVSDSTLGKGSGHPPPTGGYCCYSSIYLTEVGSGAKILCEGWCLQSKCLSWWTEGQLICICSGCGLRLSHGSGLVCVGKV